MLDAQFSPVQKKEIDQSAARIRLELMMNVFTVKIYMYFPETHIQPFTVQGTGREGWCFVIRELYSGSNRVNMVNTDTKHSTP